MKTLKQFGPYLLLLITAFVLSFSAQQSQLVATLFSNTLTGFYLSFALLLTVGYGINYFAPKTSIPVFVWAILFGTALQIPFTPITTNTDILLNIVKILAAFILFASGIAIPIKNFKKYFAPIAALSIIGTILTVFLFALALSFITTAFGFFYVPIISLLVLAAILSSIDPTSIIPTFENLHFKRPFLRDIAISEGAVNDVVGIILTRFFLLAALGASSIATLSVGEGFMPFFSQTALSALSLEIIWGILVGLLGAWILKVWSESVGKKHWSDPALFFTVPIFCFALGSIIGGSGFLAAFVAGLLFEINTGTKEVHIFFDSLVDRFIKPVVFVLLGALAPVPMLVNTIAIGATSAIIFMFIIRPLVVYISLIPWFLSKREHLSWRELLFLSFIRETGAISAILILYATASGLIAAEFIFSIALWVILYTLIIEPPLTPLLAKRLEIAD